MISKLKKRLYFPIAHYFKFLAQIRLTRWKPKIIVVTGSNGKTTLLHLLESQIGDRAKYSHQANSSYGIPFDILGLKRKNLTPDEWINLFIAAPFMTFKTLPKEKLYIVEADCDRLHEGKFLADLLKPEVMLWTGVGRSHTMNFDHLLSKFSSVEESIAYEFGHFLETTSKLTIVNGDSDLIKKQIKRTNAKVKSVSLKNTEDYKVFKDHTGFKINGKVFSINALLPKEFSLSVQMALNLLDYLNIKPDYSFFPRSGISLRETNFNLPPGRASLFKGIRNTTIIDSSYNATPDGVRSMLEMFDLYPSNKKWLVLGDMIELGNEEREEHEKLADIINKMKLDKIILVGPRVSKYTYPRLKTPRGWQAESHGSPEVDGKDKVQAFLMPKDALGFIQFNLKGREAILFKGARFLEGVIEHLLKDKNDVKKLCRREKIWQVRRIKWGL